MKRGEDVELSTQRNLAEGIDVCELHAEIGISEPSRNATSQTSELGVVGCIMLEDLVL